MLIKKLIDPIVVLKRPEKLHMVPPVDVKRMKPKNN